MGFYARGRPLDWIALDHIRVYGPLRKEPDISEFPGFLLKDLDKDSADDFSFSFGRRDPLQPLQKYFGRIDSDHIQGEFFPEIGHQLRILPFP